MNFIFHFITVLFLTKLGNLSIEILLHLFNFSIFILVSSSFQDHLSYFETFSLQDINHRIYKRSVGYQQTDPSYEKEFKQIEFNAFNRKFRLILNEKKEILDQNFQAFSVNEKGEKKVIDFRPDEFYEGKFYNFC